MSFTMLRPEARALGAGDRFMRAEKPLEEIRPLVRGHAQSVVFDADNDFSDGLLAADFRICVRSARHGVLDRVGQIVGERQLDHRGIDLDVRQRRRNPDRHVGGLRRFTNLPAGFSRRLGSPI